MSQAVDVRASGAHQSPLSLCLIALFPVGRGPVPRRAPVLAANVRDLWVSGVFHLGRQIAGDR